MCNTTTGYIFFPTYIGGVGLVGTRYKVQGTRYKVQGTRYKAQGTRYKVQGTRYSQTHKVRGMKYEF